MAEIERTTQVSLREVTDRLLAFPEKLRKNIMRGALRAAGMEVVKAARASIRSRSGRLRASIRVAVSGRIKDGAMTAKIKAGDPGRKRGGVYWAHFVERGTEPHLIVAQDRPMRATRRGLRQLSIGTTNKMVKSGTLKIGVNLVGPMVQHPGMPPQRFMERAAETATPLTVRTMAEYIAKRLAKEVKP